MAGIWHFHDMRLNHGQIETCGHPIIEQTRIGQKPIPIIGVFFVECPANALCYSPLHLSFDITGINGFASILNHRDAQNLHFARFGIHFNIGNHHRKSTAHAGRIYGCPAHNGATGFVKMTCQLFERDGLRRIIRRKVAIVKNHIISRNFPQFGRALNQLLLDIQGALIGRPPGCKCRAASPGHICFANRVCINHLRLDIFGANAEHFGQLHRNRRSGSANIRRTLDQADRAIGIDTGSRTRLQAHVEPEPRSDPASAVLTVELRLVVIRRQRSFHAFLVTNSRINRTICASRALFRRIVEPKLEWIDIQLLANFVDNRFRSKSGIGRPRRPIGHGLRFIDQHLVAVNQHMGNIVGRENAHRTWRRPTAGKTTRLIRHIGISCDHLTRFVNPHFALDKRASGRASRLQNFCATHDHLDGAPRLSRHNCGQRLEINPNFAPESTPDFHGNDLDL